MRVPPLFTAGLKIRWTGFPVDGFSVHRRILSTKRNKTRSSSASLSVIAFEEEEYKTESLKTLLAFFTSYDDDEKPKAL
jgi:hypothetical protein